MISSEKISGYSLLFVGLLIIIFAGLSAWMVFNKNIKPVELFNFGAISLDASTLLGEGFSEGQALGKSEIIPADVLNDTSNVFAHLFLMGFIASVGYKISSLGVMLLRPVEVKAKIKEV